MMWGRAVVLAVATAAFCAFPGCGGSGHQVSGTVRVKGGETLTKGLVQFSSPTSTASGAIGQDGTYRLSSTGQADGAAPGKYKVTFLDTEIGGGYDNPDEPVRKIIDSKYTNPTTTPIEVDVPGGSYDFELDPAADAAEG